MKKLQYLFAFLGILLFASCLPEADENGNMLHGLGGTTSGGDSGSTTGSKYLSKINGYDDNGNPVSTTYTYTNTLLTKVSTTDDSYTSNITYSGSKMSSAISVMKEIDDTTGVLLTITTNSTFTYNSAGYISKITSTRSTTDSSTNTTIKQNLAANITYNSANQMTGTVQKFYDETNTVLEQTLTSSFTYSGKNVTKNILTQEIPNTTTITTTTDYSNFDTKINPYATLSSDFRAYYFIATATSIGLELCANNPQNITITFGGFSIPTQISYTADSANYTISETSSGETETFEYTTF